MERCPLCGAKRTNTKGHYEMILTPDMLREIAKDIDIVAASHLGRQNVKGLLLAAAAEIERLNKVNANMATTFASGQQPPSENTEETEADPPTEKELAREMAPTLKGKKHKK